MLDPEHTETFTALRLLIDSLASRKRPLIIWVGGGVSSWCGYQRWNQLAEAFHSAYVRHEPEYPREQGQLKLLGQEYPELFQLCRKTRQDRYFSLLVDSFQPRAPKPVYQRFLDAVGTIQPLRILTTNVDELLEKNISQLQTVQRSDIERSIGLLSSGDSFVCKLHGSVSAIETTVFTSDDYAQLAVDHSYNEALVQLLRPAIVLFLGYGLRDDYLLALLNRNVDLTRIFGDGPHFAVLAEAISGLPRSVRVIKYVPERDRDHRSALQVLEEVRIVLASKAEARDDAAEGPRTAKRSDHLLYHIYPPGTWKTSDELMIVQDSTGVERQLICGHGLSEDELPRRVSTAMHDLIVGLLCFDTVHAPIAAVGRVHDLVGSEIFWRLVEDRVLRFVSWTHQEGVIFSTADSIAGGDMGSVSVFNPDRTKRTVAELIRKQLAPVGGMEHSAERLFELLEANTREIRVDEEGGIPARTRALLLRPSIRQLLGISGGTPATSIARWQVFPVLRLAEAVKIGVACEVLGIISAKLDMGTAGLAGPAFACAGGSEWTDDVASYVVRGRYGANLGSAALRDRGVLDAVLTFRRTEAGREIRAEIFERLATAEGGDVAVAVNGCLKNAIPKDILQGAQEQFIRLLTSDLKDGPHLALWNDARYAEDALGRWKQRSRRIMQEWCGRLGVGRYDFCPCGSGERFKFCCEEALRE